MTNYSNQMMPYATNATIITSLTRCDQVVNFTQLIQDLGNVYRNNTSNLLPNAFFNVSIGNFDCVSTSVKYFEHIITFTKAVSIHIQVAFASIYYDFIYANQYSFDGFYIEREQRFNLSSITLNKTESDACSSAETARDPLCRYNSSTPVCINMFSNPWIFNCSERSTTSTIPPWLTTSKDQSLLKTGLSILSPWQIGLVCASSILFVLIILLLIGCLVRRNLRSKRITFSAENLFTNMKSMQNSGVLQVQALQPVATVVQSRQIIRTAITHIEPENGTSIDNKTVVNRKASTTYTSGTCIDHAKVHNSTFPSAIPPKITKPTYIPNPHTNTISRKIHPPTSISRPVSGTSTSQLKSITDGLEESTLNESDSISLDQSNCTTPKKPSTPVSRQFNNISSVDESLHDEDAWMPILAVANAELDVLNRLENEQNPIKTIM